MYLYAIAFLFVLTVLFVGFSLLPLLFTDTPNQ